MSISDIIIASIFILATSLAFWQSIPHVIISIRIRFKK